jgi:hypothetical protein
MTMIDTMLLLILYVLAGITAPNFGASKKAVDERRKPS